LASRRSATATTTVVGTAIAASSPTVLRQLFRKALNFKAGAFCFPCKTIVRRDAMIDRSSDQRHKDSQRR